MPRSQLVNKKRHISTVLGSNRAVIFATVAVFLPLAIAVFPKPPASIQSNQSRQEPDRRVGAVLDIRPPAVSLLNPPLLPRIATARSDPQNIQGTVVIESAGRDLVIRYPNGDRFVLPATLYSAGDQLLINSLKKTETLEIYSTVALDQQQYKSWPLDLSTSLMRDINGDGWPEVVLRDYSGGAHCCTRLAILSLHPKGPVCVFSEELGSAWADFSDLDRDGRLEISTYWLDEYALGSFASGTYGIPVIYGADKNGAYRPNTRAFTKVIQAQLEKRLDELKQRSPDWQAEEQDSTRVDLFFLQYLAGHREDAYSSLKELVPANQMSVSAILDKVEESLKSNAAEVVSEPEWHSLRGAAAGK